MRLYFFPTLAPLGGLLPPILPWILAGLGALAAGLRAFRALPGRVRLTLGILATFCVLAAIGTIGLNLTQRARQNVPPHGTQAISQADWSRFEAFQHESAPPQGAALTRHRAFSSPSATGTGLVLIGTQEGTVDAFSVTDRQHLWSLRKSEPVLATPLISGTLAFVGEGIHTSQKARLTALDWEKRSVLWEREFASHIEASPFHAPQAHRLWVAAGSKGLWCLDSRDGRVVWRAELGHSDAPPVLSDGKIYALFGKQDAEGNPSGDSQIIQLNADTGRQLWKTTLNGAPWGMPLVDPQTGFLFVTTGKGVLGAPASGDQGWAHGILLSTGATLWRTELKTTPLITPTKLASHGLLFVTLKDGTIEALHADDGRRAWSRRLGPSAYAEARLIESDPPMLAFLAGDGTLSMVDAQTGKTITTEKTGTFASSAPLQHADSLLLFDSASFRSVAIPRTSGPKP